MKQIRNFQPTKTSVLSFLVVVTLLIYFSYDVGYRYPNQHASQEAEFVESLQELEKSTVPAVKNIGSVAGVSQDGQEVDGVSQEDQQPVKFVQDRSVDSSADWQPDPSWQEAVVERVVDGDTLVVSIAGVSERVRLVGIDAPEMGSNSTRECLSQESKLFLQELVEGKTVWLQPDATQADRDRYNRLLRFVFLDDGTDLGQQLLVKGLATEYLYSNQPHQYRELYLASQKIAQDQQKNLWNNELCPL